MFLRFRGLLGALFLLASAALAACAGGTTVELDGGGPDAPMAPSSAITIVGPTTIALAPTQSAPFVARWTDASGAPVEGRDVTFALEGMPRDSSLFALGARTDARGEVEGTVIAGTLPATFRVRVAAPGATPAYVDVAVGPEGFGSLLVSVEGGDARTVTRRVVRLHLADHGGAEIACDDALGRADADRTRAVDASGQAAFATLPAAQSFTVVARGENDRGTIVAEACASGVRVTADSETRLTLALVARQLGVEGEYAAFVELSPGSSPAGAIDALSVALEASVLAAGGDGALLLDSLEAELRARHASAAADALARERVTGEPDAALAARLELGGESPSHAAGWLLGEVGALSSSIAVSGTLAIARAEPTGSLATFTREGLVIGPAGAERVMLDLSALGVEARAPAALRWFGDEDRLEADELRIRMPLGKLVRAAFAGVARTRGAPDAAALLVDRAGCGALDAWISEQDEIAAECDATCVAEVCKGAIESVLGLVATGAAPLDEMRASLVLSGSMTSEDADGDLTVDALRAGVLSGGWRSADGATSEPVDASFSGTRLSPLP